MNGYEEEALRVLRQMVREQSDDTPTCPCCGHENEDAWLYNFGSDFDGSADITCGSCGAEYLCIRTCTFIFSSAQKLEPTK